MWGWEGKGRDKQYWKPWYGVAIYELHFFILKISYRKIYEEPFTRKGLLNAISICDEFTYDLLLYLFYVKVTKCLVPMLTSNHGDMCPFLRREYDLVLSEVALPCGHL